MGTYRITKDELVTALLTEPLAPGTFFHDKDKDDGKCTVCAVGAMLRNSHNGKKRRFENNDAEIVCEGAFACSEVEEAYNLKNFPSILSTEFELAGTFEDDIHELYERRDNKADHNEQYSADLNNDYELARFHALMITEGFCPPVVEFFI